MALNVRNPDTLDSLRRLAEVTGEPMTVALDRAVKERLTRLRAQATDRLTRLRRIAADTSARWPDEQRAGDLTSSLYDDPGQPA
ncbi:MAG: type II toxin-antitoxin system VapB family antitoxin [Frankiaceae bacterium]